MAATPEGTPWFYPDRVSAAPGDSVGIAASSNEADCTSVVRRVGARIGCF